MATIITVENLSKKYVISHQRQERYTTLRDVLARGTKKFLNNLVALNTREIQEPLQEEFWALKDVSFEIQEGDRVGIIGRNGAGKSTLLRILSRITEPTTGRISINGQLASLLEVGTGFHPELSGRENIYLNGAILGMSKAEIKKKFDEIVAFAEVEKFLDTPVKHYSSGMYVRLAFAVAAHLEPEILVVDEVLAVGDAQFQKKCMGKLEERSNKGRTVLFVSHSMSAIRSLCNKVILLRNGQISGYGNAADEISNYLADTKDWGSTQQIWPDSRNAPQNSFVVLKKIALCDAGGDLLSEILTSTSINVHIEFAVKLTEADVGFTLIIYDAEGNCVFSSINNRDRDGYGKPLPQGGYVAICKIPGNFFNNGWFSVAVNCFGKNFSESCMVKDALRFEIYDSPEIRGDYLGDFSGCVRPALEWCMQANNFSETTV